MGTRSSWLAAALLATLVAAPGVYGADDRAATLKRSVDNMTQGPLDFVVSPAAAGYTYYRTVAAPNASTGERLAVGLFGLPWFAIMDGGGAFFRMWAGVLEFPVGLGLLVTKSFTDAEPAPFFDTKGQGALIDTHDLKLGVFYVSNPNVE